MQSEDFPSTLDIKDFIEQKVKNRTFKDVVDDAIKKGSVSDDDFTYVKSI